MVEDYATFAADFRPGQIAALLSGDLETGINVCHECCDRYAGGDRAALYFEGAEGKGSVHGFAEFKDRSARFANFLTARGIGRGEVVACMLPRIPELIVAALGIWRAGAVYTPLFTAFGPSAIDYRLTQSQARLVVTDPANRAKLDEVADRPPVMVVTRETQVAIASGDFHFEEELERQGSDFAPVPLKRDDPFLLMFTSGTTGKSKALEVPLHALLSFIVYMKYGLGLEAGDRYWNVADPGWAYGLYYAVTGPLLLGHATHFHEGAFSAESTYRMLEKYRITNLAAAPTAYRMLMADSEMLAQHKSIRLRVASSAGEPLNPEVIRWVEENFGCPILDQYGQTEMGMVVCNHHALRHAKRAGSMGFPMPGFRVIALDEGLTELGPGQTGELAIDVPASPLFAFNGYGNQDKQPFRGDYYLSGDSVDVNEDGSFTFAGRGDDIILSAGYRIGPFDVESALIEHPAVAEAAAVGKPDAERGQIVKAFVVLRAGEKGSPALAQALKKFVRNRLSAHAYPREVAFVEALPKTPSGKIQRFKLREV